MDVKGVVLWESKFKESSRLLRVFTDKLGKITVLAQGALRKNAKRLSLTQPFTLNHYELIRGKSFYYIKDGEVLTSYYDLSRKYGKILYGNFILELLDRTAPEEEPLPGVLELLNRSLEGILTSDEELYALSFGFGLLERTGFGSEIRECIRCGNRKIKELYFDPEEGGILCENCHRPGSLPISKEDYKALYFAKYRPERFQEENIRRASRELLWTLFSLECKCHWDIRHLNSMDMIDKIQRGKRRI